MHYTYNSNTTDSIPDGLLTGVTMFDGGSISYSYDYLQRISNRNIAGKLEERYAYAAGSGENTTTTRLSTKTTSFSSSADYANESFKGRIKSTLFQSAKRIFFS